MWRITQKSLKRVNHDITDFATVESMAAGQLIHIYGWTQGMVAT